MNTRFLVYQIVMACLLLVGLSSCEDCMLDSDNMQSVRVIFKHKKSPKDTTWVQADTAFTKVYGVGAPNEAALYPKDATKPNTKVSIFSLPLQIGRSETGFVFEKNGIRDTLTFQYEQERKALTPDCGYDIKIYNLAIVHNKTSYFYPKIIHSAINKQNKYDVEVYLY